mmetsp:Transcript_61865/g.127947  ORF Transcript_61865/g.127947 Transcript_61865/m.127947 type:complete len:104 (-) Transcript_61865:43-354(-)
MTAIVNFDLHTTVTEFIHFLATFHTKTNDDFFPHHMQPSIVHAFNRKTHPTPSASISVDLLDLGAFIIPRSSGIRTPCRRRGGVTVTRHAATGGPSSPATHGL